MALVDVIGDFVHTVAQVEAVKQDMQRDLADRPLFAQVGRQSTRRIGHHHNGHRRRSPRKREVPHLIASLCIVAGAGHVSAARFLVRHPGFGQCLEHQFGDRLVGFKIPVNAITITISTQYLFCDSGFEIN